MLSPGVLLGGRYRLDERIASGGMGDVWRGTDEVLGRTVAVKILLPALLEEPGFAERFRGEARTMATINHPGVVDVYDYGSDQQIAFLVMEYVEGDALSRTLGRVGRLTPARTMALVAQAADALQAAHEKGIVHRDVKPGNLLVRPNGTLVLTDFGIARSAMVGQLTAAGSVLGTASYISPEQAAGGTATAASDVYALGVVAYQCLSGHRPFEGDNPLEIAMRHVRDQARPLPGDIPPAVRRIVEQSMAKDPAARFPSAAMLAAVARQAAATLGSPPPARPAPGHPASPAPPPPQAPGPVPASPGPVSAPGHRQVSGPVPQRAAAPYPPAPAGPVAQPAYRPPQVAGPAGYPRGAAIVPPARSGQPAGMPGRPGQPYGYGPAQQPEDGSTNRQILIVLAVVLGVLVLLCAGLISYLVRQGSENNASSVPTGLQISVRRDAPAERPVPSGGAASAIRQGATAWAGDEVRRSTGAWHGEELTSEGRQTR
jgi:eukaryotic-like serine/threonine-protein kinase